MRKLLGAGLIAGSVLLSGCANSPLSLVDAGTEVLYQLKTNQDILVEITQLNLFEQELSTVIQSATKLNSIKTKYLGLYRSGMIKQFNMSEIESDFNQGKEAYLALSAVIENNKGKISPESLQSLIKLDQSARTLSSEVDNLINIYNKSEAVRTIITFAEVAGKLALL